MRINLRHFIILILSVLSNCLIAQTVSIYGTVNNEINNTPIPFATIIIKGLNIGTTSDIEGNYEIQNVKPGQYNIQCSYLGFNTFIKTEIYVSSNKNLQLNFLLTENIELIDEVQVLGNTFNNTDASPNSLKTINASEIYRSPGGNRDISKVIANLPGVSSTPSYRNDIIVRGGSPAENRFYLDGVEIPNINHFATQGSSGGPVGILNVNFIREVDLYSGAFPANRGNALSSIMEIKQIEGNDKSFSGSFMVGSSDAALTLNTPISKKSTLLFSARRSYLQFLFKALKLPFLPTYNDLQFKYTLKPNLKNQFNFIGLAAIDNFSLNNNVSDNVEDLQQLALNNYTLNYLPINEQWNYSLGSTWKHFFEESNLFIVLSRSHLNNTTEKYLDYNDLNSPKIIDYRSEEIENKFRIEYNAKVSQYKINIGFNIEDATYINQSITPYLSDNTNTIRKVSSNLHFIKYGSFVQISKNYFNNSLTSSFGMRIDGNSFTQNTTTPNFSPRLSLAYKINDKLNINMNGARYYQLPAYTILGYSVNKDFVNEDVEYMRCDHAVLGLELNPTYYSRISLESFYKKYSNYPFSIVNELSLANLGADFGVVGNEDVSSISVGRTYGLEFLMQQKLQYKFYGLLSLTYYKSEFQDIEKTFISSSWDNQFILNLTAGKKFKRNIELGLKFRYSGGSPYTPIDLVQTSQFWHTYFRGIPDYSRLNALRLRSNHGLDVRLDKKWYFSTWTLNLYLDIENIYNFKTELPPEIGIDPNLGDLAYPNDGELINSPMLYQIVNESGTVLPSIGILIEF